MTEELIPGLLKLAEERGDFVVGFALGFVVGAGYLLAMLQSLVKILKRWRGNGG